jgi:RHS repeat-associated protein
MIGFIYNAEGERVAKGYISTWSCDPSTNGFTAKSDYVIGPSGEQLTEMGMENGRMAWEHTNVYANGQLMATYDNDGLHFHLTDGLGTRRAQTDYAGVLEQTFSSLPFGDALTGDGQGNDATEHHFTGKERDSESGNDYFSARYYASSMGRFMSPDPLPWIGWQNGDEDDQKKFESYIANPQNFNMYAYVNNNPLNKTDPTGMNACGTNNDSTCKVTVTIQDRSKDANGHYNDQYTGIKNSGNYNATAVVSVNGKETGTFLVKTTPSDSSKSATIANGTYSGTLTTHSGDVAIRLQPTNAIPTIGPNPSRQDGASIAQGILVHRAGIGNFTGVGHDGRAVSEGCQVVCTQQYGDFKRATGMVPSAGSPQQHFTVIVDTQENEPQ